MNRVRPEARPLRRSLPWASSRAHAPDSSRHRASRSSRPRVRERFCLSFGPPFPCSRPRPPSGTSELQKPLRQAPGQAGNGDHAIDEVSVAQRVRSGSSDRHAGSMPPGRQRPVTAPDDDFEKCGASNHIRASLLVDTSLSPGHRTDGRASSDEVERGLCGNI